MKQKDQEGWVVARIWQNPTHVGGINKFWDWTFTLECKSMNNEVAHIRCA